MQEWVSTVRLTPTLGERKVSDQVNLERAMGAHVRFGGHFVQARLLATCMSFVRTDTANRPM